MPGWQRGVCLLAVLCWLLAAPAVGATDGPAAVQADLPADSVVIEAQVHADGSATWSVTHRVAVEDGAGDGFAALRDRVRANRSGLRTEFREDTRRMAARASERTGRSMVVENATLSTREAGATGEYGEVVFTARWYGFADADGDLEVGDAIGGLYLPPEYRLVLSWAEGMEATDVSPSADSERERATVWNGEVDFARSEPRVTLTSDDRLGPAALPTSDDGLLVGVLVAVPLAGVLTVGLFGVRRLRGGEAASEAADEEGQSDGEPKPPADLLSNEERVLRMLEERGGRMKQGVIVEELDWSATKTSEVVADLREDEKIESYRLGRENVLALPGSGPEVPDEIDDGAGSTADDGGGNDT
jgi:uncharacterized membrane protein